MSFLKKKVTRKVLICEQSKEFHNAAALGLFNSAVGKSKGDENEKYIDSITINHMYDSNDDYEFYTKDYEFTISSGSYGF